MKKTDVEQQLESTGERFLPEWGGSSELEHMHRYLCACSISNSKVVLDIACGEGYGSEMLSNSAKKVVGVDISIDAVNHAHERYINGNLDYVAGSCSDIPLQNASIDMVVSFETIEHHDQHDQMMKEIKRVLRPDGLLVMSSPDKHIYSEAPGIVNPFHVKELYEKEFKALVGSYFRNVQYLGQRVVFGSCLFNESLRTSNANYLKYEEDIKRVAGINNPTFWIAIASDEPLPDFACSVFEDAVSEVDTLKQVLTDRNAYIVHLTQAMTDRDAQVAALTDAVTDRDRQIAAWTDAVTDRDGQIVSLTSVIQSMQESRSWKLTAPLRAVKKVIEGSR